jgi:hypothetical protein
VKTKKIRPNELAFSIQTPKVLFNVRWIGYRFAVWGSSTATYRYLH